MHHGGVHRAVPLGNGIEAAENHSVTADVDPPDQLPVLICRLQDRTRHRRQQRLDHRAGRVLGRYGGDLQRASVLGQRMLLPGGQTHCRGESLPTPQPARGVRVVTTGRSWLSS
jgi:hypothetical protein